MVSARRKKPHLEAASPRCTRSAGPRMLGQLLTYTENLYTSIPTLVGT